MQLVPEKNVSASHGPAATGRELVSIKGGSKGGSDTELKVNINIELTISERFIKSIKFITCTMFKHSYKHAKP